MQSNPLKFTEYLMSMSVVHPSCRIRWTLISRRLQRTLRHDSCFSFLSIEKSWSSKKTRDTFLSRLRFVERESEREKRVYHILYNILLLVKKNVFAPGFTSFASQLFLLYELDSVIVFYRLELLRSPRFERNRERIECTLLFSFPFLLFFVFSYWTIARN